MLDTAILRTMCLILFLLFKRKCNRLPRSNLFSLVFTFLCVFYFKFRFFKKCIQLIEIMKMNASENESFLIILTSESHQYFFNAKIPMFRVIVIDFNPRPRHIDHNFEPFAIYISMWCAAFRRDGSTTS